MPVRFPEEGNKWAFLNLPPNYELLSESGQRDARLNAFALCETPDDTVKAWSLFREHYLKPINYYKRELPSPPTHGQWVWCAASYQLNAIAAPRSFAKSTVMGIEYPAMLAVTRPGMDILIVVAKEDFARSRAAKIQAIFRNERVKADFGDLRGNARMDGRQWNAHVMELTNGSRVKITSISSRHLGERPDLIIFDDVEPDPQQTRDWERLVDDIVTALFNVFMPMLDGGTGMIIIGTLLHRRSFLYWFMVSGDARLQMWNRLLTAVEDKNGEPTWPEKFSRAEIRRKRKALGHSAFEAQYMNNPVSDDTAILKFGLKRNGYDIELEDTELKTNPLSSSSMLVRYDCQDKSRADTSPDWQTIRIPYGSAVSAMYRVVLVDYAQEVHDRADYSAIVVIGVDKNDIWWVLDAWQGRGSPAMVAEQVWRHTMRWQAKLVAVEAIGVYQALYNKVLEDRETVERTLGYMPRVKPIRYPPHLDKSTRISGLEWRFDEGRIKFPNKIEGVWKVLRNQIDLFTMDGKNLQNDDLIDAVAILPQILGVKSFKGESEDAQDRKRLNLAGRLASGNMFDEVSGLPYAGKMPADDILAAARTRQMKEKYADEDDDSRRVRAEMALPILWNVNDLARHLKRHDEDDDPYGHGRR